MITKELQQLSDKLVGSNTSAHEISKQVDYIDKNYEGGGSGGPLVVPFEYEEEYDESTETTNVKTYMKCRLSEIIAAYDAGKQILLCPSGTRPLQFDHDLTNEYCPVVNIYVKVDSGIPGSLYLNAINATYDYMNHSGTITYLGFSALLDPNDIDGSFDSENGRTEVRPLE